ncbi:MAG TPA: helix-turn-helix domain-containing protein [Acidimicrobiales bacterium]|nr:helix-turn-helix domain-containing protein [Acidimicrobiales bacterium]
MSDVDARFRERSKALGDTTRYGIYRLIAGLDRPATVAELTDEFGLNHNTVRQHLKKLREARLVEEVAEAPRGPGRPRLLYRLTDEAAAEWNDEGPYERLSLLLLEVATTGDSALEVGRAAGRRMHLDADAADPIAAMTVAMAAQGFAPRTTTVGDRTELVLEHCPFASAAEVNPQIVCSLHRGMLEGLASQVDGVALTDLIATDPRQARCLVRVDSSRTS